MGHEATCHAPLDMRVSAGEAAPLRRILPLLAGFAGAGLLVLLYLGIVAWAQGLAHALELLSQDRAFVAAIAAGFGLQIGLYSYLRLVVHHGVRLAMPTAATGAGTGTSSVAMVACCIHHVADVLPILGFSGAAVFLTQYRIPFMVVGLVVNAVGVAIMLRVVFQGRAHLRTLRARPTVEMQ